MRLAQWSGLVVALLITSSSWAGPPAERPSQAPLLVIGASYAQAATPFNGGLAPLGGTSVGFGAYMSLGQALTRSALLPGFVVNEGQAGATTLARPACDPATGTCGPAGWDSYQTQLDRALARVAMPPTFVRYNAAYVLITTPNDCLHSDAAGVPQSVSQPCTPAQLSQVVDRLIAVGHQALARGVTPIFDLPPRYDQLDLNRFAGLFGLTWVIGRSDYDTLRDLVRTRIRAELPAALVLDIWRHFKHQGDGIHPTPETAQRAAHVIATELIRRDHGARGR